jgi:hypothetical protein
MQLEWEGGGGALEREVSNRSRSALLINIWKKEVILRGTIGRLPTEEEDYL